MTRSTNDSPIHSLVIFTDLDGTLLDRRTFSPEPALSTLEKCRSLKIPVVLVTAKSRAEIEPIRETLRNDSPFISENGGGLYLPAHEFDFPPGFAQCGPYWCHRSTQSITELRQALLAAAKTVNVEIKCFSRMTVEEVARLTGLNLAQAELARDREFDEPFIVIDENHAKLMLLKNAIADMGFRYTTGGSLHHITGDFDKGQTVELLKKLYLYSKPGTRFVGLGDAQNDLPMLRLVDFPYLVRKADGDYDRTLRLDNLTITDGSGPAGFTEAVAGLIARFYKC